MHQKYYLQKSLLFMLALLYLNTVQAQENVKANCDSMIKLEIGALENNKHVQSMELLLKARTWAKKNDFYSQEFLRLNNIGTNYLRLSENGEALNYFLEANNMAVKNLSPDEEIKL